MKFSDMELTAKVLAPHLRAIHDRLAALEARAGIGPEAKDLADAYSGVWRQGQDHTKGALVTHSNSLWLALADTSGKPGSSQGWKLVSKNGQPPRGTD